MYYPYLRGKQYELIALKDLIDTLSDRKVCPVIEPVKKVISGLSRSLNLLIENDVYFILVMNPQVGDWKEKQLELIPKIKQMLLSITADMIGIDSNNNFSIGILLTPETSISYIELLLNEFPEYSFSFIHSGFNKKDNLLNIISNCNNDIDTHIFFDSTSRGYRKSFRKSDDYNRVLIEDNFKSMRNADYQEDDYFSDLIDSFEEYNMDGFGDFLIVGDNYSESGGPAYAVAIHITYYHSENEEIRIKHFVSDDRLTPANPEKKFKQALKKLIEYTETNPEIIFESNAIKDFKKLYSEKHYPGLGVVKKISIEHHIELINSLI